MVFDIIQTVVIVIIITIFVAIVNGWIIGSADTAFFNLLVKQPRFVDKTNATLNDYNFNGFTTTDRSMQLFATYNSLKYVSVFIIAAAVVIGMIIFLGEGFGVQKKGTAIEIISNSFFYLVLLMFFPLLWDTIATGTESLDVYILNPGNPTPDAAAAKAKELFIKLGGINTEVTDGNYYSKLLQDLGSAVLGNTSGMTQSFHDLMTGVFRAFMAAMIFLTMFIVGTMRIVMTATIITGLPVILAIRLIPWIRKPSDRLLDTLYGLVVSTIISSVVVVAGMAYLDTLPKDTIEQNFQATVAAMGVILLAVLMPVMLSPMLGSIITSVTGMATTALAAGITASGMVVKGAASGISSAIGGGAAAATGMSTGGGGGGTGGGFGAGLARAAMGGLGSAGRSMGIGASLGDFGQAAASIAGTAATGAAGMPARGAKASDQPPQPPLSLSAERDVGVLDTTGIKPDIAPAKTYDYKGGPPVSGVYPTLPKPVGPVPEGGHAPVISEGPKDYTALDDSIAPAMKDVPMKTESMTPTPLDSLFNQVGATREAEARAARSRKINMAFKGAAIGGIVGITHGTLKGMGSLASSHGMGNLKTAGKAAIGWLDVNHDGEINVEDAHEAFNKINNTISNYVRKAASALKSAEESKDAGKDGSFRLRDNQGVKIWDNHNTPV